MQDAIELEEFLELPTEDVARLVRAAGPKVCVFPINGTRRWFMLEYPEEAKGNFSEQYVRIAGKRHIELYELMFDHGIDTLLTPIIGPDIFERQGYDEIARQGLLWFCKSQDFLDFYDAYDVRVRVYGDVERYLGQSPYASALDAYEQLVRRTDSHKRFRLFYGVCAHDATETVAEIGFRFHQQHGRLPTRREIVEAYYGEYIEPVDLFISFERPAVFDMPLLATGNGDLYFTVAPSPCLSTRALRTILYDHLYTRRVDEDDYDELSSDGWARMRTFYQAHLDKVLGIGEQKDGIWYPLPQVRYGHDLSVSPLENEH